MVAARDNPKVHPRKCTCPKEPISRLQESRPDYKKADLDPPQMTAEMVDMEEFIAQQKLEELKFKAPETCWQHLKSCLQKAKDKEDEIAAAPIICILYREASKKQWQQVQYST